ncbi:MAG: hypothetical protein GY834_09755 [Bacteroidetes bacterium]|nr:hypothetical protein [Bacteroidota bacterium]
MLKIFLFGTGNIGKRHLQAIANLNIDYKLYCFDIHKGSLDSISGFLMNAKIDIKSM